MNTPLPPLDLITRQEAALLGHPAKSPATAPVELSLVADDRAGLRGSWWLTLPGAVTPKSTTRYDWSAA